MGTLNERRATERNGYLIQAHMQNALNFAVRADDIWSVRGYNESETNKQAEFSIKASCGSSTSGSCK